MGVLLCVVAAGVVWRLLGIDEPSKVASRERTPAPPHLIARDSSGHGNNGINQGDPIMGLPGHEGAAYSFARFGSWVDVPSRNDLNPGRRPFTLSAWANFGATPRGHRDYDLVRKGLANAPSGEYKLEVVHGGLVRCTVWDRKGKRARITDWDHPVTDGDWHLIGCARTRHSWKVLVDGSSKSLRTSLGAITNTGPLAIGSKYGADDPTSGRLDDVRLRIRGATVGLWRLNESASGPSGGGPAPPP